MTDKDIVNLAGRMRTRDDVLVALESQDATIARLRATNAELGEALKMARTYAVEFINGTGGTEECDLTDRVTLEHIDDALARAKEQT